jgi:hypothetical protein
MRFNRLWSPALIVAVAGSLAAAGLGCSSPRSYIVLLLESSSTPIANIAQITVVVSQGTTEMETLTYQAGDLAVGNSSDATVDVDMGTLSVSFSGNRAGDINFQVTALDAHGCAIGSGSALISIIRGATNEGTVFLKPEEICPGDAGAPDLPPDSSFPGCDPTGLSCPATESCQIDCQGSSYICAAAGTNSVGGACTKTSGCTAGSQCFDYTALGCGTQVCLQFCATDADCAALGDGGAGPGSFCRDPVACGGMTTGHRTCTFSCDPTAAAATAAHTGCPAGLACVLPSNMDHVDCSCPETTRTGKENTPCTTTAQCAPGLLCEQTCRAVCRCDAQNGVCTAPNDCPTSGTTCNVVPNQTRYGVCR